MKRFGPLIVAVAGAVLIALELFRPQDGGRSIFWMIVGGFALALGTAGHLQRGQGPSEPPLPKL